MTGVLKCDIVSFFGTFIGGEVSKNKTIKEKVLGQRRFGRYLVLGESEKGSRYFVCECDCGTVRDVRGDSLINGNSTSCGCFARDQISMRCSGKIQPPASSHRLRSIYESMKSRCYSPNKNDYKHYGGRGIKVCERWLEEGTRGFFNFVEDMYPTYKERFEIERLDVNKDYSVDNCMWVNRRSQVNNLRRSRVIEGYGLKLTLSEWAHLLQFNPKLLSDRVNKLNWKGDIDELLKTPFRSKSHELLHDGEIKTAKQVWFDEGFTQGQVNGRINKYGDSLKALAAEGIDFEPLSDRYCKHLTFKEGIDNLRAEERDDFEDHLLWKIENQLKEKGSYEI